MCTKCGCARTSGRCGERRDAGRSLSEAKSVKKKQLKKPDANEAKCRLKCTEIKVTETETAAVMAPDKCPDKQQNEHILPILPTDARISAKQMRRSLSVKPDTE